MTFAQAQTPDEWFKLAIEIQAQDDRLDADERRFIRDVINRLAVDQNAIPTPAHQHWLLNLKRRLNVEGRDVRDRGQ